MDMEHINDLKNVADFCELEIIVSVHWWFQYVHVHEMFVCVNIIS